MILRPISAYPSNSVDIDATQINTFYTTIQGSSSIVSAYMVTIYNAMTFSQTYTTNKINLENTLTAGQVLNINIPSTSGMINGNAYYWILRLYQSTPDIFVTNTVVQSGSTTSSIKIREHNNVKPEMYIRIGNEQRKITNYTIDLVNHIGTATVSPAFSTSPSANSIAVINTDWIDSLQFPFYAKSIPTLSITNSPTTVNSRRFTFNMEYYQDQGVPIKWHRFILTDSSENTITDTGRIYNSLLTYYFDGFISGYSYSIQGFVENIDGIVVETPKYTFTVDYPAPNIELPPFLGIIYEDDAIKVSWFDDLFSEGITEGEYHFEQNYPFVGTNSLVIDTGTVVYENLSGIELDTTDEFGEFIDATFNNSKQGKIIQLSGNSGIYYVEVKSNDINFVKNGETFFLKRVLSNVLSGQQAIQTPQADTAYIWMDDEIWNDNYYWTESLPFSKRYKITVTNNIVLIKGV